MGAQGQQGEQVARGRTAPDQAIDAGRSHPPMRVGQSGRVGRAGRHPRVRRRRWRGGGIRMKAHSLLAPALLMGVGPILIAQVSKYDGGSDYQAFCSTCHGACGKGDGVVGATLRRRPTDLTQLAKKNAGVFPRDKVFKTIEAGAKAHGGSPDMPEWSSVFAKSVQSDGVGQVKERIDSLI